MIFSHTFLYLPLNNLVSKMLKKLAKKILPKSVKEKIVEIKNNYFGGYSLKSYSQEGEDMILRRFFENQDTGFYIDVGAHHPKRFSNTYFFYKKGWRGINIDAMPGCMKLFNKFRPRDINIEKPISDKQEILKYYVFNEPALNTFSQELAKERDSKNGYFIKEIVSVQTFTLEEILDKYLPQNQDIDFLSIDIEGFDFIALRSLNLNKYKPKVILIEILSTTLEDIINHEITIYLKNFDYLIFAKTFNTVFFVNKTFFKTFFKKG